MSELATYVTAWLAAADAMLGLARELGDDDWDRPTDLPGWSVLDIYAHLAALETELAAGTPPARVVPIPDRGMAAWWTEAGVAERRGRPAPEILREYAESVAARWAHLALAMPSDPEAPAERTPGSALWTNRTLLRNRVLDTWVHQQDVCRAVGRAGGHTGAAAVIAAGVFDAAWPVVIAKKAGATPGARVAVILDGERSDYEVDSAGRGVRSDAPSAAAEAPDVTITLNREALCLLGAGRRTPETLPGTAQLEVAGDATLARRILLGLNVTP